MPARERGLRVICPDRGGIGGSAPLPGRTVRGYADEVLRLADALGLDEFAVLGYSCGGPYALSCAAGCGPRLTAPDRAELTRQDPKDVMAFFVEALRQGPAGLVTEYRLWGRGSSPARNRPTSADLPMPGSPATSSTPPRPADARASSVRSRSCSRSRPTKLSPGMPDHPRPGDRVAEPQYDGSVRRQVVIAGRSSPRFTAGPR